MSAARKLSDQELAELREDLAMLHALADRIATRYGIDVQREPIVPPRPRRARQRIPAAADVTDAELADVAAAARGAGYRVRRG